MKVNIKHMTGTLYKANGEITPITPQNGQSFTLRELQDFVGGFIEVVPLRALPGAYLVCNEEGKLDGLPYNENATAIWRGSYGDTDIILGDVVIGGGKILGENDED